MKTRTLLLVLSLGVMLPMYGLATDATQSPEATATNPPAQISAGYVDENGDGVCDVCGLDKTQAGKGLNTNCNHFVDVNQDGVCDNYGTAAQGQGMRGMRGMRGMQGGHRMNGNGACANYQDANQDGVCDNMGSAQQNGRCGNRR